MREASGYSGAGRWGGAASSHCRSLWLWVWLLLLLLPASALACRYNVRDVGFVDLEAESYRLYLFPGSEIPAETMSLLEQLPEVALRDSNLRCELVPANAATQHPAFRHLAASKEPPHPRGDRLADAVLLSPDGHALAWSLPADDRPSAGAGGLRMDGASAKHLASVLGDLVSSPKREQLLEAVSRHYAVVLLIEGQAADANRRARQAISEAITAIGDQLQSFPKPIAEPPALVELEIAALPHERVLLWSLGLDTEPTPEPRAAIVYGRARWMGPLMQGEEISEPNVRGLLSFIGADCECGLDMAWILGTRLLVRWDEARHAQVAKTLGFDPENPLVKIEVGRIAARSGVSRAAPPADQPVVRSFDPSPDAIGTPPVPQPAMLADSTRVVRRGWLFVAGLAVLVLGAGGFLLWRAARRRSG